MDFKRKNFNDLNCEDAVTFKKHRHEEYEFSQPLSPMLTPGTSPTRTDVITCLPRIALDFNELQELTPKYRTVAFSFISWRNSEPVVLLKQVKEDNKNNDYIIAHKLNEKWVKIVLPSIREIVDRILYLGNGHYILVQSTNSNALIFKTSKISKIESSLFHYEASSKLVRIINLGKGLKSIQSFNGNFAFTTFNDSFGQCRVFTKQGDCLFDFNLNTNPSIPALNEPYAINLDSNYLYLYYWDSFPLVRISLATKEIKIVQSEIPIVFAHDFAISEREAIFAGGYPKSTSMLSLPDKEKGLYRVDLISSEYEEFELIHELSGKRLVCLSSQLDILYLKAKDEENVIYLVKLGKDL